MQANSLTLTRPCYCFDWRPTYFTCYIAHIGDGRYESQKALNRAFFMSKFYASITKDLNENYFQIIVDTHINLTDNQSQQEEARY